MNILLGQTEASNIFNIFSPSVDRIFIPILFGASHESCCCFVQFFFPLDYFFFPSWIRHMGDANQLGITKWTGRSHSQSAGYLATSLKTAKVYSETVRKGGKCKDTDKYFCRHCRGGGNHWKRTCFNTARKPASASKATSFKDRLALHQVQLHHKALSVSYRDTCSGASMKRAMCFT